MANFEAYQEYQRIEEFEEDSPPGEEDLLVHVPEGLKGKHVISLSLHLITRMEPMTQVVMVLWSLYRSDSFIYITDSWHHIKNLDNFFTRISF